MFRFWEKPASFWGKTCSVFGEHMPRFWEEQAPFLGPSGSVLVKSRLGLGEIGSLLGLAWGSSLTVLNTKHVLVWIFEFLGLGVTKTKKVNRWEVGRAKCSNL